MSNPRSAGERLAVLETQVEQLQKTLEVVQQYSIALTKTLNSVILLFKILPDLINQQMPAVRSAEVRKFKNHLDLEVQQHIQRLDKLEPQES
jgi:hypothetical protein